MKWEIEVRRLGRVYSKKAERGNADRRERHIVNQHLLPESAGCVAEMGLRKSLTQHHDSWCSGAVVIARNEAACRGHCTQPWEVISGNVFATRDLGLLPHNDSPSSRRVVSEQNGKHVVRSPQYLKCGEREDR